MNRATLESALRSRKLDHTLTSALPVGPLRDDQAIAATGVSALDGVLLGGFPRGQLSEIVGPRSSGRTSLLLHMLAAATARGELVALVDALDALDVESTTATGLALDRLLWIRGNLVCNPGLCRDLNQRALDQAIKALTLVLQAGNFGLVVFDAADAPPEALRRLPFTTWLRLQRMVEGTQTACVLLGTEPMARSSAGLTLRLSPAGIRDLGLEIRATSGTNGTSEGVRFRGRLFDGLEVTASVVRARVHVQEDSTATFATKVTYV
jgi:recombination protein RecA